MVEWPQSSIGSLGRWQWKKEEMEGIQKVTESGGRIDANSMCQVRWWVTSGQSHGNVLAKKWFLCLIMGKIVRWIMVSKYGGSVCYKNYWWAVMQLMLFQRDIIRVCDQTFDFLDGVNHDAWLCLQLSRDVVNMFLVMAPFGFQCLNAYLKCLIMIHLEM